MEQGWYRGRTGGCRDEARFILSIKKENCDSLEEIDLVESLTKI